MQEAFRLGGWGMYPTALVGLVLVIAAVQFARAPERGLLLVKRLGVLTAFVSSLGFVSGVVHAFTSLGGVDDVREAPVIALIGFGESLVNIGFGLFLLVIATATVCIGTFRARASSAELADPHQR